MHYAVESYERSVGIVYKRAEQAILDRKGYAAGTLGWLSRRFVLTL